MDGTATTRTIVRPRRDAHNDWTAAGEVIGLPLSTYKTTGEHSQFCKGFLLVQGWHSQFCKDAHREVGQRRISRGIRLVRTQPTANLASRPLLRVHRNHTSVALGFHTPSTLEPRD